MKSRSRSFLPLFSIVAITMVQSAAADTGTWSGAFDGEWDTTASNWSGVTGTPWNAANGAGNTATFNTASLAAVVNGPVYTNGITFGTTGDLSGSTINLVGTTPGISVATGQTGTISSVVAGSAGLIKSDAGLLTLSNATYTGGTTVSGGRLVLENTMTGSSNFVTNAELEFNLTTGNQQLIGGTLSGTGNLIKTGGSNLILSDWSGNQTVAFTGTDSVIDVQGGTLSNFFAAGVYGPVVNWSGNRAGLTVASGATFDMINNSVTVDELNGAGTINRDSWEPTRTLTLGVNNGSGTFSGSILNPKTGVAIVKEGSGTQTLSGSGIGHKGGTTVNGGRLVLENTLTGNTSYTTHAELEFKLTTGNQQLQSGTFSGTGKLIKTGGSELLLGNHGGTPTIVLTGADSVIDVQAGKINNFGPNSPNWSGNKAGLTVAAGATFETNNANVTVDELNGDGTISKDTWESSTTLTIGVNDGSGTYTGSIYNAPKNALALVKQGTGTQALSGAVSYFGGTTVNGGRLVLENTLTGSSSYTTHAELEFKLTTGNKQLQSGTFSGTGKLIKTGGYELILSNWGGAQTVALTGADSVIDVQAGKLSNYNEAAFGAPPTNWSGNKAGLTVASGATFEINNTSTIVDELNGAGTINKGTWQSAVTLTIGVNNGSGNLTGAITQTVGTALSLVKQGSGTQTLSGANSYNGATTVSGGKLVVGLDNVGSLANTAVTVKDGATLGGSGTIGGATALESGGIHAAGNSVGIQKFTGNLTYQDGSIFAWEIAKTNPGSQTRGTDYDAVNVTATLAGLDGVDGNSTTDAIFRIVIGDASFSDDFWATQNHTWSDIFTAANGSSVKTDWKSIFGGGFEYYNGNTAIDAPTTGSFGWSGDNNNSLTWTFTAVPEPTSALAGLLITAGLLRRRRRNVGC